ncbi:RNA polymerase sigma factor [Caulobacter segnis]|uniref:RNA polymerase sigma factor n=1 Tax=Caulobacter segnis TaxID=88688 RepID=UPI0024109FEF|nr:RNA polymerase sigma factor [Caulobacter segnis]MDG2520442.1 RNA polymerase sigma factor [Caulobacter segnis]
MRSILPHEPALRAWLGAKRNAGIEIDDIVQETYTILAGRETVADITHPKAYLFQVAHSLIVRHIRRARIVSIQAMDDLMIDTGADDAPSPEDCAIARDDLRRLGQAIAAMPGQTRQAFTLRRVHGLSQREIAARMKLSENTVEKHIARGVRLLIEWAASGGNPTLQTSMKKQPKVAAPHGPTRNKSKH